MEAMVQKIRVDELAGIVKPHGFEFELLNSEEVSSSIRTLSFRDTIPVWR